MTADHSTLLFLPGFFYKIKNFFSFVGEHLHDPPPFNGQFFMTPPFSAVSKSCDPPAVSTPSPPLISDKSPKTKILFLKVLFICFYTWDFKPIKRAVYSWWRGDRILTEHIIRKVISSPRGGGGEGHDSLI